VIRARSALFASLLALCVGCDHATKLAAVAWLGSGVHSLGAGLVRFELARNPGAFLSLGATLPPVLRTAVLLVVVPIALLLVCTVALSGRAARPAFVAALGLLAGGGLANWLDRVLHRGCVTDFVSIGVGPLHTGIFNLADVAVVAGVLLLATSALRGGDEPAG
jgi:signal peptidase II